MQSWRQASGRPTSGTPSRHLQHGMAAIRKSPWQARVSTQGPEGMVLDGPEDSGRKLKLCSYLMSQTGNLRKNSRTWGRERRESQELGLKGRVGQVAR